MSQIDTSFNTRESRREEAFEQVWSNVLEDVFEDVAKYYDRANVVASFGLWTWICNRFIASIELEPGYRVLDVCAGTNAVGIAMLEKQPGIQVKAIDRSAAMQRVGKDSASKKGLTIDCLQGDVHQLPYPDDYFDVATLQFASRHLRVMEVFSEIKRVLKPGGHFYHHDMLRPANELVERAYYTYLKACLTVTAWLFNSSESALSCKQYFINVLRMFYSADELTVLLQDLGFEPVTARTVLAGMIGHHKARKPLA